MLLRLLRPHQWIKNSFVFSGIFFAHAWNNIALTKQVILIAIAFSILSSAVYIFNDILDCTHDVQHPYKKNRPIAAGTIVKSTAFSWAIILGIISFYLASFTTITVMWIFLSYIFLNILYSFYLKNLIYWDVACIAMGFILRILAGTTAVGIPPSGCLLICSLMLTAYLGFIKRRTEQQFFTVTQNLRSFFPQYSPKILHYLINIFAAGSIGSYTFYVIHQWQINPSKPQILFTIPFAVYAIFRYAQISQPTAEAMIATSAAMNVSSPHKKIGLDFAVDVWRDPLLLASIISWTVMMTVWIR